MPDSTITDTFKNPDAECDPGANLQFLTPSANTRKTEYPAAESDRGRYYSQ